MIKAGAEYYLVPISERSYSGPMGKKKSIRGPPVLYHNLWHQMAEAIQRTYEHSSQLNHFPSGPPTSFKPTAKEYGLKDAYYSESDIQLRGAYHASTTDDNSWNFGANEDAEMRRLRSESAAQAQKQKAATHEKQPAREVRASTLAKGKGKAKAIVESEDEEEANEDVDMSEGEEGDVDVDLDEDEDVDVEGEDVSKLLARISLLLTDQLLTAFGR